jgi:hypothetical protein
MRTGSKPSKIDSVFVGEIAANLLGANRLEATYGFMNSSTGDRMGSGHCSLWSEETMKKLLELVDAMEKDLCQNLFDDPGHTTASGDASTDTTSGEIPSL